MIPAFLIALREGIEAALIVGIVLSALRRLGAGERRRAVWAGVGAAIVTSVVAGLTLNALGVVFEGRGEQIFEGLAMFLAAGVLSWMIYWMGRQGRKAQTDLELDTQRAVEAGNERLLFGLSFIAVVREGIETVLFLTAAAFSSTAVQTMIGAAAGLMAAIAVGWLIFATGKRLNLRLFFNLTGLLLLLVAAGLLAHGIHEFQEAALLPSVVEHVWDISGILNENGIVGGLLGALFGYNSNPSLIEVVVYGLYLLIVPLLVVIAPSMARRRRMT